MLQLLTDKVPTQKVLILMRQMRVLMLKAILLQAAYSRTQKTKALPLEPFHMLREILQRLVITHMPKVVDAERKIVQKVNQNLVLIVT